MRDIIVWTDRDYRTFEPLPSTTSPVSDCDVRWSSANFWSNIYLCNRCDSPVKLHFVFQYPIWAFMILLEMQMTDLSHCSKITFTHVHGPPVMRFEWSIGENFLRTPECIVPKAYFHEADSNLMNRLEQYQKDRWLSERNRKWDEHRRRMIERDSLMLVCEATSVSGAKRSESGAERLMFTYPVQGNAGIPKTTGLKEIPNWRNVPNK